MNINWIRGKQITQKEIIEVENKLCIILPQEYKEIVLHNDGAKPEVQDEKMEWKDGIVGNDKVSFILIKIKDCLKGIDLLWYYDQSKRYVPGGLIPFARDGGGSLLFFDYRELKSEPKIWYQQSEDGYDEEYFQECELEEKSLEERQQETLVFIANSFKEMLEKIVPDTW